MLAEILAMPDAQAPTALRAWLLVGAAIFCEGERRPVAARRLSDQALAIARTGTMSRSWPRCSRIRACSASCWVTWTALAPRPRRHANSFGVRAIDVVRRRN